MILYLIHAYATRHYDRTSEVRLAMKDGFLGHTRLDRWIEDYLREHPDGKVVVRYQSEQRHWRYGHKKKVAKKLFVQTASGRAH